MLDTPIRSCIAVRVRSTPNHFCSYSLSASSILPWFPSSPTYTGPIVVQAFALSFIQSLLDSHPRPKVSFSRLTFLPPPSIRALEPALKSFQVDRIFCFYFSLSQSWPSSLAFFLPTAHRLLSVLWMMTRYESLAWDGSLTQLQELPSCSVWSWVQEAKTRF